MSSDAGFKGGSVVEQQGDDSVFDFHEKQNDRRGNAVRISSHLTRVGSTSITIGFEVEFNNSGNVLTATVPFSK